MSTEHSAPEGAQVDLATPEIVEKVARAIQDAHAPGHELNYVALYQARAAIAALALASVTSREKP